MYVWISRLITTLFLCFAFGTFASAQLANAIDELKACARIGEADTRHGCYDKLGQRVLAEERVAESEVAPSRQITVDSTSTNAVTAAKSEAPPAVAASAPTTAAAALPPAPAASAKNTKQMASDMGGAMFEKKPDPADGKIQGKIRACKQGIDRRWHFFFVNGQVWKQVNDIRLSFKECDFNATISKDSFGYKMQIEGRKRKIRIARRK